MQDYRVTKYDPRCRDSSGSYTKDEWTCFSDVGKEVGGTVLTISEYEAVEAAYLDCAAGFILESGAGELQVTDLENHASIELDFQCGDLLQGIDLRRAMKLVLRNLIWARFSAQSGCFIHFGHDFYMYIGVTKACERAAEVAVERGLFVEPHPSPYRNLTD